MNKSFEKKVNEFIEALKNFEEQYELSGEFENPWKNANDFEKLRAFLNLNKRKNVKYVLIGEAAGRKGCLQSKIPFCDTETAKKIIKGINFNFSEKEVTSQRIYQIFGNEFIAWNVFPYNPQNSKKKNRKPNSAERKAGIKLLEKFLKLFAKDKEVIFFGKVARNAISKYENLKKKYLIHPSPVADRYRTLENGHKCSWEEYMKDNGF